MSRNEGESNETEKKGGVKRKTVLQIIFVAIVIGLLAVAAVYLRGPRPDNSSSPDSEGFTPDRDYSKGDLPRLNSAILAGTEQFWSREFEKAGKTYKPPTIVLFNGSISSVCGYAKAVSGPFYCPKDERIYVDLGVTRELVNRLGMDGNFAQAYVLTHLVGHHIQKLLNTAQPSPVENKTVDQYPKVSNSDLELNADLYSGIVFAHYAKLRNFDEKEIEKWLATVSDIAGNLCKPPQDCLVPDPFTHGIIQQRHEWFNLGLKMSDSEKIDLLKGKPASSPGFPTSK